MERAVPAATAAGVGDGFAPKVAVGDETGVIPARVGVAVAAGVACADVGAAGIGVAAGPLVAEGVAHIGAERVAEG